MPAHTSLNGQSVCVNKCSLPQPISSALVLVKSKSLHLQMVFKVWSADPWGPARLFLLLYLKLEGGKFLNTFNFYKLFHLEDRYNTVCILLNRIFYFVFLLIVVLSLWSRDTIVSIANRQQTGVPIPSGARVISLLQNVQTGFRAHPASYSVGTEVYFPRACG